MRIGTLEIIVIIIVIIVLVIITHIARFRGSSNRKQSQTSRVNSTKQEGQEKTKLWIYIKRMGVVSIIVSILLALSIVSIFKWAIQSYFWALILLGLGLGLLFISRKK